MIGKGLTAFSSVIALIAMSAPSHARRLPGGAVWTVPRMSSFEPIRDPTLENALRQLRKGETVFRVRVAAPKIAALNSTIVIGFGDVAVPVNAGWHWAPYETVDDGRPAYCSEGDGAAKKIIRAALMTPKAYMPRLCMFDSDADGKFEAAALDADFIGGGMPPAARKYVNIEPQPYSVAAHPYKPNGEFEVYFRGFPFQNDRFTLGLRKSGGKWPDLFSEFLLNTNGEDFWYYQAEYFFPRYVSGQISSVKVLGAELEVSNVDRATRTMQVRVAKASSGKIYYLVAQNTLPAYRFFEGSE